MSTVGEPLRIGVLGAARISALSIVEPARLTGARLVAVAARDRGRAEAFAAEHGVERVLDGYADVLADPEVEAVYNPLANSLHAPWNIRALLAGKHVRSVRSRRPGRPRRRGRCGTSSGRPAGRSWRASTTATTRW